MEAHKHAEFIRGWADGQTIQVFALNKWVDDYNPSWHSSCTYRIKPAEPAEPEHKKYPETKLMPKDIMQLHDKYFARGGKNYAAVQVANYILKHACDCGQIVIRAEFDRAIGDRDARDMAVAEAVKWAAWGWHLDKNNGWQRVLPAIDLQAVIESLKKDNNAP